MTTDNQPIATAASTEQEQMRRIRAARRMWHERFDQATWLCPALDAGDAGAFVDWLVDLAITALRKDPRMPRLLFDDWSLVLADWRRQAERELTTMIEDKVDRGDDRG